MMTAPDTTLKKEAQSTFLALENVSKVYPTAKGPLTVLENVNLTVNEGEFICIIGHSGCGKSTMLNMISGFNQPTTGTVKLHGEPITAPGPDRMMVFQNYCLLPWKNAHDNVALAVNTVCKDQPKAEREATVRKYMEMVGLTEAAKKKPHQISGGMKQRVAIARALSIHPEVLILDEPFGALDAITKEELQEELLQIWRENKITVLMITHDIDEALFLADRIVMMTNGPRANVGEILEVPFDRPRNREQLTDDPKYMELRNYALDYLYHRYAHDEEEELEDEVAPNPLWKVAGIVGGIAAIALVGWGLFQTVAPRPQSSGNSAIEAAQ
ncbi:nitrate/nitrite transport system ATP-binding protein [[Synechococcus] sp. NIES-970]|nr:nitrate/nitrite transport system ATP-binding protein [[Synechococcus] sp. NIES-970]